MEKKEKIFVDGMRFEAPSDTQKEKTPWIKGKISIKVGELIPFLQKHGISTGWVNIDLKKSDNTGKLYLELNTWKPKDTTSEPIDYPNEDIKHEDIAF